MNRPRLIFAIVSTIIEEIAIAAAGIWGLPQIGVEFPLWGIILIMITWLSYSVYTFKKGTKALKIGHILGMPNMIGTKGRVTSALNPEGWVRIRGELWSAKSLSGEIQPGQDVIVTGQKRLKLEVKESDPVNNRDTSQ
ncbi:MAG: NfeD family protein [Dehalococcoidales bacterium]|nr:NfeD family protein [Dehalococcoidales bacterium]